MDDVCCPSELGGGSCTAGNVCTANATCCPVATPYRCGSGNGTCQAAPCNGTAQSTTLSIATQSGTVIPTSTVSGASASTPTAAAATTATSTTSAGTSGQKGGWGVAKASASGGTGALLILFGMILVGLV
ncbi:hypothetical protein M427DRAFT_57995 [Gonapodya prolifera JEL478]|uniref:Uncharacterized protein n=1 Tax=Gonapodya prolifera (strain JEL478) TaxID=1344416 RepID=A0A139ABZ2_GONPJ|nr:hypothetical protein M427DRAFT_57995 [Gonapodya prolifera JEL478]|eukprot:KXS13995.1 hypothetical protein M427DRAFT_57995 [Gonapodya prolifera JEL478]